MAADLEEGGLHLGTPYDNTQNPEPKLDFFLSNYSVH